MFKAREGKRMIEPGNIYLGDCLELMPDIQDKSIDMILCDLPYGTTACKWDVIIPFEPLWKQYKRIIKDNGAIVLTASQPFTSLLVVSNIKDFGYSLVWEKTKKTGFLNAKRQPLRKHEDILVFGRGGTYNPQGTKECDKMVNRGDESGTGDCYGNATPIYKQTTENYPFSIIYAPSEMFTVHPTQKPVDLFAYLINTYTKPGELVLDNCCGSGTTAIAAIRTGRDWICMEKDPGYYEIARKRIEAEQSQLRLAL